MTRTLVLLRVDRSTYEDIKSRVLAAGQPDRMMAGERVNLDEVAIEIDENDAPCEEWMSVDHLANLGYQVEIDIHSNRYRHRQFDVTGERTLPWSPGYPVLEG